MPKIVNHDERRSYIIESASTFIANKGFDQLTIRGLANSVNISTGMITHYFNSKDEILFATLREIHDRFYMRINEATQKKEGIEALRARMQTTLPLTDPIKKDWAIMFQFWGRAIAVKKLSSFMQEQHEKLYKIDLKNIEIAQKNKDISPLLSSENIFQQLDAMTVGMGVTSIFNPDSLSREKAFQIIEQTLARLA